MCCLIIQFYKNYNAYENKLYLRLILQVLIIFLIALKTCENTMLNINIYELPRKNINYILILVQTLHNSFQKYLF